MCACGCGKRVNHPKSTYLPGHHHRGVKNPAYREYLKRQTRMLGGHPDLIPGCEPPKVDGYVRMRAEDYGDSVSTLKFEGLGLSWDVPWAWEFYAVEDETSRIIAEYERNGLVYCRLPSSGLRSDPERTKDVAERLEEAVEKQKEKHPKIYERILREEQMKRKYPPLPRQIPLEETWDDYVPPPPPISIQDLWAYEPPETEEPVPSGTPKDWSLQELEYIERYDGPKDNETMTRVAEELGVSLSSWYHMKSKISKAGGAKEMFEQLQDSKETRSRKEPPQVADDPEPDALQTALGKTYRMIQVGGSTPPGYVLDIPRAIAAPFIEEFGDQVLIEVYEDGIFIKPAQPAEVIKAA